MSGNTEVMRWAKEYIAAQQALNDARAQLMKHTNTFVVGGGVEQLPPFLATETVLRDKVRERDYVVQRTHEELAAAVSAQLDQHAWQCKGEIDGEEVTVIAYITVSRVIVRPAQKQSLAHGAAAAAVRAGNGRQGR
jgi:hypothetical protein